MADESLTQTTQLLHRARGGDPAALDALFATFLPRVRRIVAARMGRRVAALAEVEDVVQETLLDAFKGLDRCDHASMGAFYLWLARCVERNLVDQVRFAAARKRGGGRVRTFADQERSSLVLAVPWSGTSPSAGAAAGEIDSRLENALLGLRDEHREVVTLRVLCDLSFDEIARELGHDKPELARAWFSRGLAQLRARLEGTPLADHDAP
ncbi:MAG: sigma-70 family RNA polymerase sigma factor [Planctomycetes bacterium]|nr:sigma-70 family RNA polymerase sigma factor [Planctomycetota bacterium]